MEMNWRVFRQEGDITWLTAHVATLTAKWELDCKEQEGKWETSKETITVVQ